MLKKITHAFGKNEQSESQPDLFATDAAASRISLHIKIKASRSGSLSGSSSSPSFHASSSSSSSSLTAGSSGGAPLSSNSFSPIPSPPLETTSAREHSTIAEPRVRPVPKCTSTDSVLVHPHAPASPWPIKVRPARHSMPISTTPDTWRQLDKKTVLPRCAVYIHNKYCLTCNTRIIVRLNEQRIEQRCFGVEHCVYSDNIEIVDHAFTVADFEGYVHIAHHTPELFEVTHSESRMIQACVSPHIAQPCVYSILTAASVAPLLSPRSSPRSMLPEPIALCHDELTTTDSASNFDRFQHDWLVGQPSCLCSPSTCKDTSTHHCDPLTCKDKQPYHHSNTAIVKLCHFYGPWSFNKQYIFPYYKCTLCAWWRPLLLIPPRTMVRPYTAKCLVVPEINIVEVCELRDTTIPKELNKSIMDYLVKGNL